MARKKTDPKVTGVKHTGVTSGTAGKQFRDKKGELKIKKDKNFGGVDPVDYRKKVAGTGNSFFSGGTAPRVGGAPSKSTGKMATGTASKKLVNKAKRNVNKTAASPQAKRAARRALGR